MFGLFNLGKWKIWITIALFIISVISWKFYDYNRIIKDQAATIAKLQEQLVVARVDVQTERENVKLITQVVEDQHKTINNLKARNQNIQKKYDDFKKKSDAEKYKSQQALDLMQSKLWASKECSSGLELNKQISKLTYDDL